MTSSTINFKLEDHNTKHVELDSMHTNTNTLNS